MVTGVTRTYNVSLRQVERVIDREVGGRVIGMTVLAVQGGAPLFVADTSVTEMPDSHDLVEIAVEAARGGETARLHAARGVHLLLHLRQSPRASAAPRCARPVAMMDARDDLDFEYEGEMPPGGRARSREARQLPPSCG